MLINKKDKTRREQSCSFTEIIETTNRKLAPSQSGLLLIQIIIIQKLKIIYKKNDGSSAVTSDSQFET